MGSKFGGSRENGLQQSLHRKRIRLVGRAGRLVELIRESLSLW